MSDIKNILSKLDSLSEQIGFRPGARDFSGQRIEPKFDISPVQDIAPPMGAVGGIAKPRIKVQPGQTPRQAISQAQQKIPTLTKEIPAAKPSVDPYGRMEPKGDITGEKSFAGKRKDPGGPLPTPSKSNEPTLETNKFPGYWKGKDSAAQAKKKMVGMESKKISEQSWLKRMTAKLQASDPYKTYEPDDQGFKFTPEQEKWLGGANRQDPDILKRMPGPKPPVSYFKNADDQRRAQELNFGRQNLNTVRSAVGKEKLAPEKFPTSMTSNLGPLRPEIANMSSDEVNTQISNLAAQGGRRGEPTPPPEDLDPRTRQTYAGGAYAQPIRPQSNIVSRDTEPTTGVSTDLPSKLSGGGADNDYSSAPTTTTTTPRRGAMPRASTPGAYYVANEPTPTPPAPRPQGTTASGVVKPAYTLDKKIPPASTFAQDVAARKAQLNPFAQPTVKENRHNAVNRLARKFENYIENKFGLVENNYIPKKKNLK